MCLSVEVRESYLCELRSRLSEKRLLHTIGVERLAMNLARQYGENLCAVQTAALFHDIAKQLRGKEMLAYAKKNGISVCKILQTEPNLLHGQVAAHRMRNEFGIQDIDVLNAVRYHTTGREGMSVLEKIIFLADAMEEFRDYTGVEQIREMAQSSLDRAVLLSLSQTINYLVENKRPILSESIAAYNDMLSVINNA